MLINHIYVNKSQHIPLVFWDFLGSIHMNLRHLSPNLLSRNSNVIDTGGSADLELTLGFECVSDVHPDGGG